MNVQINPHRLSGQVTPPPSKSMEHRVILARMLAGTTDCLDKKGDSQDIQATKRCVTVLKKVGAGDLPVLDCGESGSTLRFLIPIALTLAGGGRFVGHGRLMERPQTPYFDLFREKGIFYEVNQGVLTVQGRLAPGCYRLPGNVSSQFVTGLLYALPLLPGDSQLWLTSPLESRGYVDMTLDVLNRFGITVENREYTSFYIPGNQCYRENQVEIEADWSQAGFWYAANFLGSQINVRGTNPDSLQADRSIVDHQRNMMIPGEVTIDISACPDLLPALAVMAAVRQGTTYFVNAARLRMKESDRLASTARFLNTLGGHVQERPEELIVYGGGKLSGGMVDGANDHRIVMAAAVAATVCAAPVTILGGEAINKSYPEFWADYQALGGEIHVL